MNRRGTRIALIAAVCGLATATAPQAIADGGAKTQIAIKKLTNGGAKGVVTSGDSKCEDKGRKVSLFRLDDFVSVKIKITYTNSDGSWRVRKSLQDGKYFAKVDAIPGCRYAVSRNKNLG